MQARTATLPYYCKKQRRGGSIIALWDVSYIVKARCQPIVVMCIDWSEKPEPLFKAIQHSINTPFALWQSSTAAPWLIRLLLPCQSIMNHPLCHRTTLHSPAGRKKGGGRTLGSGIKICGGRIGREMEECSRCWRRKSWRKRGEGRLAGTMRKKGEWPKREDPMEEKRKIWKRYEYWCQGNLMMGKAWTRNPARWTRET